MVEEEAGWSRDFSTILDEEGGVWLLILLKPSLEQRFFHDFGREEGVWLLILLKPRKEVPLNYRLLSC